MHRFSTAILCAFLAGCAAHQPLPRLSIKDPVPQPVAVVSDASIATPVVTGGSEADNRRLALALHNELADQGYEVKPSGAWKITGTVTNNGVVWTIAAPDKATRIVTQSTLSTPALMGIVPGLRSHLPRPSTPI